MRDSKICSITIYSIGDIFCGYKTSQICPISPSAVVF